jgi:anti-sigma regulatory factor (Ser/Thr protein kinase)
MESMQVRDPTDVAGARRRIVALAHRMGYNETQAGRVAIVATELAQNVLRHGGGGEMLAREDPLRYSGIEMIALDRGPGMADVSACLRDGFSTGGTSGNGLGAIQRLAGEVLIHSPKGAGTAVLVRMGGDGEAANGFAPARDAAAARADAPGALRASIPGAVRAGIPGAVRTDLPGAIRTDLAGALRTTAAVCVAKTGETVCGDSAEIVFRPDGTIGLMLADGLGHGPNAAAASQEAARLFRKHAAATPAAILPVLHAGLRATRGAAVAVASIDPVGRQVTYGGIGNIAGFVTDTGGTRRMVSHSGTAGHTAGRIQVFSYPIYNRPVVVMFSDGLATSWSPESHPGLFTLDPTLIAGVLYRDHARGRDDASVVVWKG